VTGPTRIEQKPKKPGGIWLPRSPILQIFGISHFRPVSRSF